MLAAVLQGVFEHLHAKGIKAPEPVGLQVMVHGVVPLGGQLGGPGAPAAALYWRLHVCSVAGWLVGECTI